MQLSVMLMWFIDGKGNGPLFGIGMLSDSVVNTFWSSKMLALSKVLFVSMPLFR